MTQSIEDQKLELYRRYKKGEAKSTLALAFNISARTVGRWIESVENGGVKAPQAVAAVKLTDEQEEGRIYFEYTTEGKSKSWLANRYGISRSTITRRIDAYLEVSGKRDLVVPATKADVVEEAMAERKKAADSFFNKALKKSAATKKPEGKAVEPVVKYTVVGTAKSISVTKTVNGKLENTVSVDSKAETYSEALELVMRNSMAQEDLAEVYLLLQPAKMLEAFTDGQISVDLAKKTIFFTPENGTPFPVSNRLTQRILSTLAEEGREGCTTLLNFMKKLMSNPSYRATNELYGFLEHNDIKLAPDGNFYAWKVVRADYFDKHSNTMDNSVGNTVTVNRNQVDENSEQTCSHGLHVCAKSYIGHFGSGTDRIVKVSVNPRDVVAIPKDYNDSKMRTCGYVVVEDVTEQWNSEFRS